MAGAVEDPRAAEKAALLERYDSQIDWYWAGNSKQKWRFIQSRIWTIVLGATLTLVASLASAEFIEGSDFWDTVFKVATPVLAAVLTIVTGLFQTFQPGAAWREMNLAAAQLEKERDRIRLTPPYRLDVLAEMDRFNDLVIDETRRFFDRVTGSTHDADEPADRPALVHEAPPAAAAAAPAYGGEASHEEGDGAPPGGYAAEGEYEDEGEQP